MIILMPKRKTTVLALDTKRNQMKLKVRNYREDVNGPLKLNRELKQGVSVC